MRWTPYVQVGEARFDMTRPEVERRWGRPNRTGRNAAALNELDYGCLVLRFQDSGRLEEVTLQADVLDFGAVAVPRPALVAFVRAHDPQCFDRGGFLVSPAFGLAVAPAGGPWITALARHCIGAWRAL